MKILTIKQKEAGYMRRTSAIFFLSVTILFSMMTITPVVACGPKKSLPLRFNAVLGSAIFNIPLTIDIDGESVNGYLGIDCYHYKGSIDFDLVGYYLAVDPYEGPYIQLLVLIDNKDARSLLIQAGYPEDILLCVKSSDLRVSNLGRTIIATVPSIDGYPDLPSGTFVFTASSWKLQWDSYSIPTPTGYVYTFTYSYWDATLSVRLDNTRSRNFRWKLLPTETIRCYLSNNLILTIQPPALTV